MPMHDVIVVGLGTVGSSACLELARRKVSVLGIDARHPPHMAGSHHGETRSIRRAYLEGTAYVPMALRAWEKWRELERNTGRELLSVTENLTIGPTGSPAVAGMLASAAAFDIPHEALSSGDIRRRWPQLNVAAGMAGGLETRAGILFPERCIGTMLNEAENAGALLQFDEPVTGWQYSGERITVTTAKGKYECDRLLVAAGSAGKPFLGRTGSLLTPKRVAVHWVDAPPGDSYALGRFPVNFWQVTDAGGQALEFYSLPCCGNNRRIKVAVHHPLPDADVDVPPAPMPEETERLRDICSTYLPELAGASMSAETCLYTMTPDSDFYLGPLPEHPRVFAAALSGHGFKFAPVLGEVFADLLTDTPPAYDIAMFAPSRFALPLRE